MTPIELTSRRKRLGLSQEELGRCLALVSPMPDGSPRQPVKQSTIAGWEGSRGIPESVDLTLRGSLDAIEEMSDRMCDRIKSITESRSGMLDSPTVKVDAYETDESMWRDWPDTKGWPHVLWNIAATVAMDELEDESGIIGEMTVIE